MVCALFFCFCHKIRRQSIEYTEKEKRRIKKELPFVFHVVSREVKGQFSKFLISNINLTSLSIDSTHFFFLESQVSYLYIGITLSDYNIACGPGFGNWESL